MHLIALSWDVERPDRLDPAVHELARGLAGCGATCEVVALGSDPVETRSVVDGVDVTWASEAPPVLPDTAEYDLARVLAVATRMSAAAEQRCQRRAPDAVLAAGWQTAWTASTLRASRSMPVVAWLDSTAPARGGGDLDDLDDTGRLVAQVEWWLTYEARRVVAPSQAVARELRRTYRLPSDKVEVVPTRPAREAARRLLAVTEQAVVEEPAASSTPRQPLRPMLRRSPLGLVGQDPEPPA